MNGASTVGILVVLGVVTTVCIFGMVLQPEKTTEIAGFGSLIGLGLLTLLTSVYAKKELQDTKKELKEVKQTTNATYTLQNSHTSAQLRGNAIMARRLAVATNDPNDLAIAAAAEHDYAEHEKSQAMVDRGYGLDVKPPPRISNPVGPAAPVPAPTPPAAPAPVVAAPVAAPAPAAPVAAPAPPAEPAVEKMTIEGHEMAKIEITKEKAK